MPFLQRTPCPCSPACRPSICCVSAWGDRCPRRHHPCLRVQSASDSSDFSLEARFAAELAAREEANAQAAEREAASTFNGEALLSLLRQKYGRSYDVSLVQRKYMGKVFVALNVMWKYKEQQSFSYTEEQYMHRLEYVAAALVNWGVVSSVQSQLAATKERPRVGKAVSIMLDVPEDKAREWIAL